MRSFVFIFSVLIFGSHFCEPIKSKLDIISLPDILSKYSAGLKNIIFFILLLKIGRDYSLPIIIPFFVSNKQLIPTSSFREEMGDISSLYEGSLFDSS